MLERRNLKKDSSEMKNQKKNTDGKEILKKDNPEKEQSEQL